MCGGLDVLEVGLFVGAEGGGDADEDGVGFGEAGEVGRRLEFGIRNSEFGIAIAWQAGRLPHKGFRDVLWSCRPGGSCQAGRVEVFYVAFASVDLVDFFGVGVEAEDLEAFFGEGQGEGEANVAEADDADEGRAVVNYLLELFSDVACHFWFSVLNSEFLPTRGRG